MKNSGIFSICKHGVCKVGVLYKQVGREGILYYKGAGIA